MDRNLELIQIGVRWNRFCPGVDLVLEELKPKYNWEIEKWGGDSLSRTVVWVSEDVQHSISMLLGGGDKKPRLKIWAASWSDDQERLKRRSVSMKPEIIIAPVRSSVFRPLVSRLADWLQGGFEELGEVQETDLQPYPGSF